jgi:ADP-ribose pyrophosphatase YjhB (NUDIX family)
MNIQEAIRFLEEQIQTPTSGLPEDICLFVSWHLPGGIIRFKEKLETRLLKVAQQELGTAITFEPGPMALNQIICDHNTRGHFISLLYKCYLSSKYVPQNKGLRDTDNGYLKWHDACPQNLIKVHEIYRKWV